MTVRYKCPHSLNKLFDEIDARWPHRTHSLDGWYNPSRHSVGHNAGHRGLIHAIDVDRRGIDPMYIVDHIKKNGHILWYMIWSRHLYSNTYGWHVRPYTGSNPHTDHIHIEIYQTTTAEEFDGYWGIAPGGTAIKPAPRPSSDFANRDYRPYLLSAASGFLTRGSKVYNHGQSIRHTRG